MALYLALVFVYVFFPITSLILSSVLGPVAVGLIGADPSFLSYEKGVFASTKGGKCDLGQADHGECHERESI